MPRVAGTEDFKFNHTMIRVKDAQKSLEFYQVGLHSSSKKDIGNDIVSFRMYWE